MVQKTAPQYSSGNASGDLTLALGHHPVLNTKASAAVAIGPASDVAGGEDVRHAGGEISSTIDRRCRQPGPVQTGARPRCQPPRIRHRVECPSSSRKAPSFTWSTFRPTSRSTPWSRWAAAISSASWSEDARHRLLLGGDHGYRMRRSRSDAAASSGYLSPMEFERQVGLA